MHPTLFAAKTPHKPAVIMAGSGETVTYGELDARSNRLAQLFRAEGLKVGDHIAFLLENSPRYYEICWAAQRAGLYYTAISTRLTPGEVAYIVADSGSRIFITSLAMAETAAEVAPLLGPGVKRFVLGGALDGYRSLEQALARQPSTPIVDQIAGGQMLYSSGTTGRPKGVKRVLSGEAFDAPPLAIQLFQVLYKFTADTIYLSPAPLYHAAPLVYSMTAHRFGGTVVVMEHFDPAWSLELIEKHRVTHSQWVPTMFVRMLKLPEDVRRKYDLSSHRMAIHAAAPCPVQIKRQMIEWWGPIIYEYYAGTEGNGMVFIGSEEWLKHPGTVGRPILGELKIVGEDGNEMPAGQPGTIYFANGPAFEYHNDPEKTAQAFNAKGWSTLGDVGYVDKDGYLFLTDRKAYMIISGGVNIYPQEAENLLITHPKVADVAVIGVPNEDFGEEVKAVVQPIDMKLAGPELAHELIAFCRASLADVKCPRSIDFEPELPRHPTGKLYKRLIRDRYWAGHASKII
ncbi:MAG TPA: acyl-CoA synthetase [Candidatus Cybelea sp.]|nr:acyl-CoA synthetase [Candidatus Cybelea sp.]